MLSLRIERHGAQFCEDVLDNCQHADFFFNNGHLASCYHNDEHMLTEYYSDPMDVKLFEDGKETELWELATNANKLYTKEWNDKQQIDEEMVTDVLDYYAKDELVEVEEEYYD
jgi:hypothetical protein